MSETKQPPQRLMISAETKPSLPRHIKMRHDAGRNRWIILAPERVFNPDDTAVEVLKLCNGETSVGEIAAKLSADYGAPLDVVSEDIIAMLQDLADKGVVRG